ncbi:MAG: ABC transporter ATP-binding protein, partial [Ruminococcus sp.]|nr:ABC transporter ATP-binding protein [Candidatus Apopatosoma intestinale]
MKNEEKKKALPFFGVGKIIPFMKKYRRIIFFMILCGLAGSAMDVIIPVFQRYSLNHFIGEHTLDGIIWFALLYLAAVVFSGLSNYAACSRAMRVEVSINKDLRNAVFDHLQTLSFSFFNQNSVGYVHARIMSDTSRIGSLVSWTMMDCVWHMSYLVGAIAVMFAMNAKLATLIILIVPLIVVLFSIFQKKLIHVNREVREINSRITGNFNEGITGAKTIKSLAIEEKMEQSFVSDTSAMRKKAVRAAHLRGMFAATMNLASSLALAIVLWRGGYIAEEEVGTFSLFMSYAEGIMEPIRWLIDAISDLITTQVNIERVTNMLETESDVKDTPEVIETYGDSFSPKKENWEPIRGDIEFRDVDFRYPDGEEFVLRNFNLKIPFGTNVAIVGETG